MLLLAAEPTPHLTDYGRILMGDMPASYLLEGALRMVVLYVVMLGSLRLMGQRMAGQFSRPELAALVSLAATIGLPLLSPERGLADAFVIAAVLVAGQQVVARFTARYPRAGRALKGQYTVLVADGVLNLRHMEQAVLSQERLFAQLRSKSLSHLGQVERLYMESGGKFSLVKADEPRPGLSVLPSWDADFRRVQPEVAGQFACRQCGQVQPAAQRPTGACPTCQAHDWEPAVEAGELAAAKAS